MGRLMGLSWISSTLGKFRNRTLRFKFAQFPRYPNFACGNELRCTSCFRQLNTYGNPPNPLLGFASQGSTTLQIPLNKILGSKSHRVFYGAGNVVVLETISHLLKVVKSEEYQWVEFNLQKLIA